MAHDLAGDINQLAIEIEYEYSLVIAFRQAVFHMKTNPNEFQVVLWATTNISDPKNQI